LQEAGRDYEILTGSDGIDLLNFIRDDEMDGNLIKCIITDENMEFMNGSQAAQIIRNLVEKGSIKPVNIITSTCNEDEITKKRILESGSQCVITKPIDTAELEAMFKKLNII
jgi:CheY-like chemotaxis protein